MEQQGEHNKSANLRRLAIIISRVFGPLSSLPLGLVYLSVFKTGLDVDVRFKVGGTLLFGLYLLPLLVALFFLYSKRVSDIDITDRKERRLLLVLVSFVLWLTLLIVLTMPVTVLLLKILLFSCLSFTSIAVLTFWDKVSLHVSSITTLSFVLVMIFGLYGAISFLLIPIIMWARVYLGKHNSHQVLVGALVPVLLFLTEYLVMLE